MTVTPYKFFRKEFVHYCETLLMQGRIWSGSNIPFSSYAEHFFDNDSIWVQDKLASGTPDHPALSPLYLRKLQSTVRLHLLPRYMMFRVYYSMN